MFVLSRNVPAGYKVIATLVTAALLMWVLGLHSFAQAANVTNVYDLLSDSAPGADSNHTIEFVAPSGVAAGENITITFPAGFDLTSIVEDDVDLEINGVDALTAAAPSGATWGVAVSGQDLVITSQTGTIGGTATVTVKVGTNANGSGTGANQIANPSPAGGNQSYEIDISAGTDTGHTRVVILDTVEVTATVNTSFTFTVTGTGAGTSVNTLTTNATSSSTTIPFGTLTAGAPVTLAQDLAVTTNAIHGFVVTVEEDQHLLSSTGADIDNFSNGSDTDTPGTWAANPLTNNIADEDTWGHWGITSEDADTVGNRGVEFGAGEFIGVSTTPRAIFAHDGPADGTTAGIGATTVGYQVEITALQEAADDYSTTLTYIATPTF